MSSDFEWDPGKAESNEKKHGVSFVEASSIFFDPLSLTIPDPHHSLEESRFILMGTSILGKLLVVVHTDRDDKIRIISAREATPSERRQYER